MTQEMQSLRQSVASMPPPVPAVPAGDPAAVVDPTAPPAGPPGANPAGAPPANVSPTQMWDRVYAIYAAGQYDFAVDGFEAYIRTFPTSPRADDAQLYIGHALHGAGKYNEAVVALQKVITGYPQSDSVPAAYYKLGLTYEALKQLDPARKAFETVIKNHPSAYEAVLAQQALERLKTRKD
jgi:tol-pal system protein YbgF